MLIGFIGDIHEDTINLQYALNLLKQLKVDEFICLGDIAGYNVQWFDEWKERDANACVNLIKNNCIRVIPGNHDLFALRKLPEYRGGFRYAQNWYNLDFSEREQLGSGKVWLYEDLELSALLNRSNRTYLDSLPEINHIRADDLNLCFTHYIFPNITGSEEGFVENHEDITGHLNWMNQQGFDIGFCGHGHVEGLAAGGKTAFRGYGFDQPVKVSLGSVVIAPPVVRGHRKTGVLTFDTESMTVTAHQISGT